jgi:hypothetical protein
MPELTFVTSRGLAREGINYTLSVFHTSTGYFAIWDCKACDYEGNGMTGLPSCDAAMAAGRVEIEKHHAQRHLKALSSK